MPSVMSSLVELLYKTHAHARAQTHTHTQRSLPGLCSVVSLVCSVSFSSGSSLFSTVSKCSVAEGKEVSVLRLSVVEVVQHDE